MLKYTPTKNAALIAKQYLKQEFRKMFSDVKDDKFYKKIDMSIDSLERRRGEILFWNLLAAISEGWRLNSVFMILSNDRYKWKLEIIPTNKIYLTGMSPVMDKYVIKKFNHSPEAFAKAWKTDKIMRQEIIKTGFRAYGV